MRTLFVFLGLLVPAVGGAQTPSLTVDQAVAEAIRANPRRAAAVADVAAARSGVSAARSLTNPSLTLTPAITHRGSDEELLLQQPLELNGTRRARTRVAEARLRSVEAESQIALSDLVFDTKVAYVDLARAQELRTVAQDLQTTAEEVDRVTRRQVELGSRPVIDQTQTGIELARTRQQLALAESHVTGAEAALNVLMGREPTAAIGKCTLASMGGERLLSMAGVRGGQALTPCPLSQQLGEGVRQGSLGSFPLSQQLGDAGTRLRVGGEGRLRAVRLGEAVRAQGVVSDPLAQLLGEGAGGEGRIRVLPTALNVPTSPPPDASANDPLTRRAEIAAAEARLQARKQERSLARAEGRPDLIPQFRIERLTRGVDGAGLGIGIALPLLDFGSRRHRVREAEAAARADEQRLEATREQVRLEVAQSATRLQAAESVVTSYQSGLLDHARRLLDASRTGFQTGATGVLAVLEAQRTYRTVLTEYTEALAARARAVAEYERATGVLTTPGHEG